MVHFLIRYRTTAPPHTAIVRVVESTLPSSGVLVRTLSGEVDATIARERLLAKLSGLVALATLIVAGVGVYAVVANQVADRRREIGIRLALGGAPSAIRRLVIRHTSVTFAVGLLIGWLASLAMVRFVAVLAYGFDPHDPVIGTICAAVLAIVTVMAVALPLREAVAVDPTTTLRAE